MERLIAILKALVNARFYGQVLVKFEAGRIVLIEKTEKMKP